MMINQPYGIRCHAGGPARPALSYKITVDKWRLGYAVRGGRRAREFRRDRGRVNVRTKGDVGTTPSSRSRRCTEG